MERYYCDLCGIEMAESFSRIEETIIVKSLSGMSGQGIKRIDICKKCRANWHFNFF